MREIKRHVTGFYTRSLHLDHEGEWDFDLLWKPVESFTIYAGWLRAVREGHARLHRGLTSAAPCWSCRRGARPARGDGRGRARDRHRARRRPDPALGDGLRPHVTYVAIEGARHDVVLSREEPRRAAYDAI